MNFIQISSRIQEEDLPGERDRLLGAFTLLGFIGPPALPSDDLRESRLSALTRRLCMDNFAAIKPDSALSSVGAGEGKLCGSLAETFELNNVQSR